MKSNKATNYISRLELRHKEIFDTTEIKMPGLLDLPVETRLEIYRKLPKRERIVHSWNVLATPWKWTCRSVYRLQLQILCVNRQIFSEAKLVMYEENLWLFELDLSKIHWDPEHYRAKYQQLPNTLVFQHLKNIRISYLLDGKAENICLWPAVLHAFLKKMFKILAKAPALRHIEIEWRDTHSMNLSSQESWEPLSKIYGPTTEQAWKLLLQPLALLPKNISFSVGEIEIWICQGRSGIGWKVESAEDWVKDLLKDAMSRRGIQDLGRTFALMEI